MDTVFMKEPYGVGEPKEVDATPEILSPLMVAGWSQCDPPAVKIPEVKDNVDH